MFITMLRLVWLYITPEIGIKEIFERRKLALGLDGRSENRRFVLKIRWNQFATKRWIENCFWKGVWTEMKQIWEEKLGNRANFWIKKKLNRMVMEFVRSFKYTLEVIWDSSKNTHTNLVHKLIKTITNALTNWKCNS